jgi:pimeloyl-ACP methyl ester carboxylesterase
VELVTSKDGTRIAFWRSGRGPALLLAHGAVADHTTTWRLILSALEEHFTVCAMDRRGRGASGDTQPYDLAREAEDINAVIEAIGEDVNVFGHSYGALCAIEAARFTTRICKLVLYEGVPLLGDGLYPPDVVARMEALVAAGDSEGALMALLQDIVEMPPEEIDIMRAQTVAWERRLANTGTLPRELKTEVGYVFDAARFKAMRVPTVFLVGGDSPAREMNNARSVSAGLPNAQIAVLPGQQHAAMYSAPELFVRELVRLLAT